MKTPRWVRFTPGPMRNMRCSDCRREYMRWLGVFGIGHKTARFFTYAWRGLWIAAVMFSIAWYLPGMLF
ncbi:MAG: hypothetical protein FWG05_00360 [Kiritimatiellaeota bacterium]|nr:hypothetical protein [Kiritimatiellota bacterium]